MTFTDRLRQRLTEYTPEEGRVFVVCGALGHPGCGRVIPYYRLCGRGVRTVGCPKCGALYFHPARIPEWRAALWLVWGWVTRRGDPRMPLRTAASKYA